MTDEKTYHLIDAYLNGELLGRKLDAFKAQLKEDTELQQAVSTQKAIIAAIENSREKELKALMTKGTSARVVAMSPKSKFAMATAATVALLAVAAIYIIPTFNNKAETADATVENTESEEPITFVDSEQKGDSNYRANELEDTKVDTQTLAVVMPEEKAIVPPMPEVVTTDIESVYDYDGAQEDDAIEEEATDDIAKDIVKTETNSITQAPTQDANDQILKDELIGSKAFTVLSLSPSFESENLSEVSVQTTSKRKKSRAEKKAQKEAAENATRADNTSTTTRGIKVEYWKSPVNYKGYKYNGATVQLYGVTQDKNLAFKELDSRLYIKMDGKQYYLGNNKTHQRLVEVTNPTLLKVLNE